MGDGCIMEGISSEASSLAGHLKLDNLIAIYDSNKISLDGPLDQSCSENTKQRYESYGWKVYEVDGHDLFALEDVLTQINESQTEPVLVIAHTTIGKGSPNKSGSHKVHGSPLGEDEVKATKEALGLPQEEFYISSKVQSYFQDKLKESEQKEESWNLLFDAWKKEFPDLYQELKNMQNKVLPDNLEEELSNFSLKTPLASRSSSNLVIQLLAAKLPQLYGGSADLSCSDKTLIDDKGLIAPSQFDGRNIKYGVREFAMAAIASGLFQTQCITPFCGTFLTFSDYNRNGIRLAALSHLQVIYQFTHDSIFLGEDGPTHQPVEHVMSLRSIPNLHVIRPADNNEVKMAWLSALKYTGPTVLILSRQNLPDLSGTKVSYEKGMSKGAYIVKKEKKQPDVTLVATGSEVKLALECAEALQTLGKDVRVISMPCWELFESQDKEYKETIFGGNLGRRVSIEAGSDIGWYKYIGREGLAICIETFGASAPASVLADEYGFNVDTIIERILNEF